MNTPTRAAALLAMAVLALHLPYLPASLEDLDSINFALGIGQFDVALHQPHPPGYPVYIALAKAVHAVVPNEAHALAVVSTGAAAAAVWALALLLTAWVPPSPATLGTVLAVTTPLFWMTAARPLSDMLGLAAALGAQALAVRATTVTALMVAAFVAGIGTGVRSQVVWLSVPLLAVVTWQWRRSARVAFPRAAALTVTAFATGALVWFVPLIMLSGGGGAYLQALASQGGEDFAGVAMLATQPSPRLLLSALHSTWVAPWGAWPVAVLALTAAAYGAVRLKHTAPHVLGWLLVAFGPYALFHLAFQETATTRYGLPLVVPVAALAGMGLAGLPGRAGAVMVAAAVVAGIAFTQPALRAYSASPAPAFRVLRDMQLQSAASGSKAPTLAMHRRQELDMRRPLQWDRARVPQWSAHLPAPPKHEWLELVKYWNGGGRAPIWFLADPPRSDLRLIDPQSLVLKGTYRWPVDATTFLGGVRPNVMDWYEINPPGWYVGEGWALTPESAGVARDEGRGPGRAPIDAWVRRHGGPVTLMVGGRKLTGAVPANVTVAIDGHPVWNAAVPPGFFLEFVTIAPAVLTGAGDYAHLTVRADTEEVSIEQFDFQPTDRTVVGFGEGWQELEYSPRTGRLWRWSSERAVLRLRSPRRPLLLHLDGEFETSAQTARVVVRAGERVIAEHHVAHRFVLDVPIPPEVVAPDGETRLTLETDQWYVPAETNWRPTADRRHLGLRLFECTVKPAQ